MQRFEVSGMTCSACVAHVEKAVRKVPGVTGCSVSLVTESMNVEGDASAEDIVAAVERAGYGASPVGGPVAGGHTAGQTGNKRNNNDRQSGIATTLGAGGKGGPAGKSAKVPRYKLLARRLAWSVGFVLVLMYVGMGAMMWDWPLPEFFEGNPVGSGLLQLILCTVVMAINREFFSSGMKSLAAGSPNMDTLIALGAGTSYLYSLVLLFAMTAGGTAQHAHLYFDSAAMILALISVGKMLEARSMGRTTDALKALVALTPKTAVLLRDGGELSVPVGEVRPGDVFVLRPGYAVTVDGRVLEGSGAVDESSLTGESMPVDKSAGATVNAATVNLSGYLRCEATKVGAETTFSRIVQLVSEATATKAPIARIADKVSAVFVPAVIGVALLTFAVWMICGADLGTALQHAVSVLVVSCPCALGLATPVAIVTGSGKAARNGILFKTAEAMETCGRVRNVVLDKTGTLTRGRAAVTAVVPADGCSEGRLLELACALEKMSAHPLAVAVVEYCSSRGVAPAAELADFRSFAGGGVQAQFDGVRLAAGNPEFVGADVLSGNAALRKSYAELADAGATPLVFALGGELLGIVAVADVLRDDSAQAVAELRELGLCVTMLTGDNERTARAVAAAAGVDDMRAGLLPADKERIVRELSASGRTAMVGDGVNDAPSLVAADVGIAVGSGLDAAVDAAGVVLMKNTLRDVAAAVRIGRAVLKNIKENLFWAFFYNVCGIPLAAGVFVPLTGWELSPVFCAAAMGLSSFCVVSNALRLNFMKVYPAACDGKCQPINTDKVMSTKVLKVEGMMCPNCEKHVVKALQAVPGVASAAADHKAGTATVECEGDVPAESLAAAVAEAGYTVVE